MKKKKRIAAAKRASEYRFARNAVRELVKGYFYFLAAGSFAEGSAEKRMAVDLAKERWSSFVTMVLLGAQSHRSGRIDEFLRLVADAVPNIFEGEPPPRGAMRYAIRAEAYDRAILNGKRKDERSSRLQPFFSEIFSEVKSDLPRENERTLRRSLAVMGRLFSKKPGRPLGRKNAVRRNSKTAAARKTASWLRFTRAENEKLRRAVERRCGLTSLKKDLPRRKPRAA